MTPPHPLLLHRQNTVRPAKPDALKLPPENSDWVTKPLPSAVFKRRGGPPAPVSVDPNSSDELPYRYDTLHSRSCTAQYFLPPRCWRSERRRFPPRRLAPSHRSSALRLTPSR